MLAFSVREALRQAVAAFGPAGGRVDLGCPSTPEAVFWAVEAAPRASPARPEPADPWRRLTRGCEQWTGSRPSQQLRRRAVSPACWSR